MVATSPPAPDPRASAAASAAAAVAGGGATPSPHPGGALFVNAVEVPTPVALPVIGTLPPWLAGTLLRNGPGTFSIPRGDGGAPPLTFSHWFDGLGILHRFHLPGDGAVEYSARKTAAEEEARLAAGGVLGATFGQDPCGGVFARARSAWAGMVNERTNVNVSVGRFGRSGGDVYARTDGNVLLRVDPESLAVTGRTSYEAHNKELRGPLSSAHPSACPETGDTFNFTMDFGAAGATYKVFCVPAEGGLSGAYEVARFDAPPSYIHSFFLTSRYVVLGGWPALFRPLRMLWGGNVANAIDFDAASPATFYVLDRRRPGAGGGDGGGGGAAAATSAAPLVATYTAPPLFCFHTVNAHETPGGDLLLTLCYYPDSAIIKDLALGKLASAPSRDFHRPRLATYTLSNPAAVAAATAAGGGGGGRRRAARPAPTPAEGPVFLSGQHLELPRINPAYATRRHTHTYGASYVEADTERVDFYWNALAKISTVTPAEGTGAAPPTVVEWSEAGCYPSEPVFVARPGGTAEDDGVVLSVVVDVPRQRTFLLVLDALRFSELARAEVDAVVPLTFHGTFLDEEAAASD